MALQQIQFGVRTLLDRSKPVSTERVVNMFARKNAPEAKSEYALHGTPGMRLWKELPEGNIRGLARTSNHVFAVSGNALYIIDRFRNATLLGNVTGALPVSMAAGTVLSGGALLDAVAVVSDFDIYVATANGLFSTLPLTNCQGVAVHDGYALFCERGSQKVIASALNDIGNLTNAGIEFTLANALPDANVGIINANRETWVFGERSAQIYYNAGLPAFPFARTPSGVVEKGLLAPRSLAAYEGTIFWLGDDKRVYRNNGYTAQPISDSTADGMLAKFSNLNSAVGFVYQQEGHVFYALSCDSGTLVFDATTGLMHERRSLDSARWRANSHVYMFETLLVGDERTGKIFELDLDTYDEDGTRMIASATSPPIHANAKRATMGQVFIDCETGVGLAEGQGAEPRIMLDWSDDGGATYGNELWRSLGPIGARKTRAAWHRLGQFRQRTLRVRISDPVKRCILDAYCDVEVGA